MGPGPTRHAFEVLLAAASPAADAWARLGGLDRAGLDWDLLVEQAIAHGVATQLFECLRSNGREQAPTAAWHQLENHYFSVVGSNLPRLEQLIELLDRLAGARVPAVAFKGLLLEVTLARDPLTRESTDHDILVARGDMARASRALAEAGYLPLESGRRKRDEEGRPLQKHYLFEPENAALAMVELHADVMEPEWAITLPVDGLLSRAALVEVPGVPLRQLCAEDLLLTLALHGTSHGWLRLMWLSDLAVLLHRLPDSVVLRALERAAGIGCHRILTVSCDLACGLMAVTPPAALAAAVHDDPVTRSLSSRLARALPRPLAGTGAMRLPAIDRLRIRERRRDSLLSAFLHARLGWFRLVERLSPFRFGDAERPVRWPSGAPGRQ